MINATQRDFLNSVENDKGELILTVTDQTKNHKSIPREKRDVRCKRYQIITTYKLEEITYRNPMVTREKYKDNFSLELLHRKWMKKPINKTIIAHYE